MLSGGREAIRAVMSVKSENCAELPSTGTPCALVFPCIGTFGTLGTLG